MNVSGQFPDFTGPAALPGMGKGKKKPPAKSAKAPAKKTPAKKSAKNKAMGTKPQWRQIADEMAGKC